MHGWGGNCDSFLGLAKSLWNDYRVTLVDFYGFGQTPHPDFALTVDDYVLSIINLIRNYNMTDVTLVCHSFGGRVGIKLAAKYGYIIKKLVLIDSAGIMPKRGLIYRFKILRHKILTKFNIPHQSGSEDYKKLCGTIRETFKNVVNEDLIRYLSQIKQSTLIIWGNKDKETPIYMARKMHRRIKNSALAIFCGCGHFAYVERHDLFCDMVGSFLSYDGNDLGEYWIQLYNGRNGVVKIPVPEPK